MDRGSYNKILAKASWTEEEKKSMERYRVRNAVIMAAGLGTRLRPLTYEVPKPLISVNGIRIIDTIIDSLLANGINDIYIIRGYLAEKFDILLEKYPMLHMINNLMYEQGNNILSACTAGNLIAGAYVMPADIYIRNARIFTPYQYTSNVLGYRTDASEDWCIETDESGIIKRLSPGGKKCYKDTGIFYWSIEDGISLSRDIKFVCSNQEGRQRYWSNVPFEICRGKYKSFIRECRKEDVIEIDTLTDLIAIDSTYER